MTTIAEVRLWGNTIGAVSLEQDENIASFQFDGSFIESRIEVSPINMRLESDRVYQFHNLNLESFHGLPGLLADSLPDKFGNALIDKWLARQGRTPQSFNAVERLCYIGDRGMGALEYLPAEGPKRATSNKIQVDQMVKLASEILSERNDLNISFENESKDQAMKDILQIGTSAGGARAKAVIAWNPETNEVRSGEVKTKKGFEYWILKFDGVSNNRDRELADPGGYGVIEYAYSKMAKAAGINMEECHLFEENNRRHFMTKRFDRLADGEKLHMQSLGALGHYDYKKAGAYSYEQAFMVIRHLKLSMDDTEEQFRRMVFNVIARNQDDHVKNIAFMMNKLGEWSLSPAFDITYSFNPSGKWTANHQMSINDKINHFTLDDFKACAKVTSMKRGRAEKIIDDVKKVVSNWKEFAKKANVDTQHSEKIQQTLRLNEF
ncbi:MAG: serine/threonine-protein kinase HipA [Gammaproteobacteria bacterium]|jgi:serine/threonine-protein kinase HipA